MSDKKRKQLAVYAFRIQRRYGIIDSFLRSPLDEMEIKVDEDMAEQGTIIAWNRSIRQRCDDYLCHVGWDADGRIVLGRINVELAACPTDYMKLQIREHAMLGEEKFLLDISKSKNLAAARDVIAVATRKLGLNKTYKQLVSGGEVYLVKCGDKKVEREYPQLDLRRPVNTYATLWIWDKVKFEKDYVDECGRLYKIEDWCRGKTPHGIRVFTLAGRYVGWIPAEGRVPTWSGDMSSVES